MDTTELSKKTLFFVLPFTLYFVGRRLRRAQGGLFLPPCNPRLLSELAFGSLVRAPRCAWRSP
jgi:hypothetical protein